METPDERTTAPTTTPVGRSLEVRYRIDAPLDALRLTVLGILLTVGLSVGVPVGSAHGSLAGAAAGVLAPVAFAFLARWKFTQRGFRVVADWAIGAR